MSFKYILPDPTINLQRVIDNGDRLQGLKPSSGQLLTFNGNLVWNDVPLTIPTLQEVLEQGYNATIPIELDSSDNVVIDNDDLLFTAINGTSKLSATEKDFFSSTTSISTAETQTFTDNSNTLVLTAENQTFTTDDYTNVYTATSFQLTSTGTNLITATEQLINDNGTHLMTASEQTISNSTNTSSYSATPTQVTLTNGTDSVVLKPLSIEISSINVPAEFVGFYDDTTGNVPTISLNEHKITLTNKGVPVNKYFIPFEDYETNAVFPTDEVVNCMARHLNTIWFGCNSKLYEWNGTMSLVATFNGPIYCLTFNHYNDKLYIGGDFTTFTTTTTTTANRVAIYDGTVQPIFWDSTLEEGLNGVCRTICFPPITYLGKNWAWFGGDFTHTSGLTTILNYLGCVDVDTNKISEIFNNGSSPVGFDGPVRCISNNELNNTMITGDFSTLNCVVTTVSSIPTTVTCSKIISINWGDYNQVNDVYQMGATDTSFSGASNLINCYCSNGSFYYVAGNFTGVDGQFNNLVRAEPTIPSGLLAEVGNPPDPVSAICFTSDSQFFYSQSSTIVKLGKGVIGIIPNTASAIIFTGYNKILVSTYQLSTTPAYIWLPEPQKISIPHPIWFNGIQYTGGVLLDGKGAYCVAVYDGTDYWIISYSENMIQGWS
jgi:hypothetical protein